MESETVWQHDTLAVEDGHVVGTAYTTETADGHIVTASVSSYPYDGGEKTNHVPNVVIVGEDGAILSNPHARDSRDPKKAIERAKETAEYAYDNIEEFLS